MDVLQNNVWCAMFKYSINEFHRYNNVLGFFGVFWGFFLGGRGLAGVVGGGLGRLACAFSFSKRVDGKVHLIVETGVGHFHLED